MKIIFTFPQDSSFLITNEQILNQFLNNSFTDKEVSFRDIDSLMYLKNYFRTPSLEDSKDLISNYYKYIHDNMNTAVSEGNPAIIKVRNHIVTNGDFNTMNLNSKILEENIMEFFKEHNYQQMDIADIFIAKKNENSYTNQILKMAEDLVAQFTQIKNAINPSDEISKLLTGQFIPGTKFKQDIIKAFMGTQDGFIRGYKEGSTVTTNVFKVRVVE